MRVSLKSEMPRHPENASSPKTTQSSSNSLEPASPDPMATESEVAWRQHEEVFRRFVELVQDYAIFMLDSAGHVSTWNIGAERLKGYKASEIIGQHFSKFYPEPEARAGRPDWELEVAAREGRFEDEGWRVRKDGSRFWANVIITAVRDKRGKLVGFGKVTRDFTDRMLAQQALDRANQYLKQEIDERKRAQQKLADSENSLRHLSLHLLRTQDEERKRIGRDLHDSLGQMLTAMKMTLQALVQAGNEKREDLLRCMHLADDCIKEVRTISYLMYPPMLEELGLKSAIPWYLDGFAARSGIRTTFEVSLELDRLSRDVELALFRVLQEALTNVHRHSKSEVAHVRISSSQGSAILEVQDEGEGVPSKILRDAAESRLATPGVGLRGMDERMRQLGGRLEVLSNGHGTTLRATVPVEPGLDSTE